jgi:hypothetical protein
MKLLIVMALLLNGCAALLDGVGGSLQAQNYRQQPTTQCYTHCYAGNCTTTCN